ncbi:HNH endonuclease [Azovibrio restrictus]|uniref:HNH endonuclease n=1 Tax=Azovibrio restrictus TaxID=146938 RepID=UPI0026EA82A8|nr:HNH endonuclease [Azovibrio restrictus]
MSSAAKLPGGIALEIITAELAEAIHPYDAPAAPLGILERTRLEKAAQDAGFDLTASLEGDWLVFRSTAFPFTVGVAPGRDGYRVGVSDAGLARRVAIEFPPVIAEALPPWEACLDGIADYPTLHRLFARIAAVGRVLAGEGLRTFEASCRQSPDTTEATRLVVQRVGQDIFRASLLAYWGQRCAVSGLAIPGLLRASHIKPWADCTSDAERLDVFNGLLLAPQLDALFDSGWITFLDSGQIRISQALDAASRTCLGLTGSETIVGLTERHQVYLTWHRKHRFGRRS